MTQLPVDFTLPDENGRPWRLSEHLGDPVVLLFLRGDWWPYCNGQLVSCARQYEEFTKRRAIVVGISVDGVARNKAMVEKLVLPFPMLADPDASVIAAYGVYHEKEQRARPAAFVIARDLSIPYRYVGRDFADRPLTQESLEALETAQSAPRRELRSDPLPPGPRAPADTGRVPLPLEHLPPYMRGVNFALEAIGTRLPEDAHLQSEVETYRAIAQDYMKHGLATLKLKAEGTRT